MVTISDFEADRQGKGYRAVFSWGPGRRALVEALRLMQEPRVLQQMVAALRNGRPAFEGAVADYQSSAPYQSAVTDRGPGAPTVLRLNQAVGVACRLVMEAAGYVKSGTRKPLRDPSGSFGSAHLYQ